MVSGREKNAYLDAQRLQNQFNGADLAKKIEIFKNANHGKNRLLPLNKEFCQKNWHRLIYLISTPENGQEIYKALYNESDRATKIWGSVAALRAIEVWSGPKTANAITENYAEFIYTFKDSLRYAWQIEVARQILKKLQ